jgi:hypothetical protein
MLKLERRHILERCRVVEDHGLGGISLTISDTQDKPGGHQAHPHDLEAEC